MALNTNTYGYLVDPLFSFLDEKGHNIKNGYIKVCLAGTTTTVLTFANWDGTTYNPENIELDDSGRPVNSVIVPKGNAYKVLICDSKHDENDPIRVIDKLFANGASISTSGDIVQGLNSVESSSSFIKVTVDDDNVTLSTDYGVLKDSSFANEYDEYGSYEEGEYFRRDNVLYRVTSVEETTEGVDYTFETAKLANDVADIASDVNTHSTELANLDLSKTNKDYAESTYAKKTELEGYSKKQDIAATYDDTATYSVGDYFYKDGNLYRVTKWEETPSGLDYAFVQVKVGTELKNKVFDAPSDNNQYARKNGGWVIVEGGGSGGATSWDNIVGKPETFPPSSHTHEIADVSGLQTALNDKASKSALLLKADVSHTHSVSDITDLQDLNFVATYNVTTFEAISAAIEAGKCVKCDVSGYIYELVSSTGDKHSFAATIKSGNTINQESAYVNSDDEWDSESVALAKSSDVRDLVYRVTSLTTNKQLKEAIQNEKHIILERNTQGGSYEYEFTGSGNSGIHFASVGSNALDFADIVVEGKEDDAAVEIIYSNKIVPTKTSDLTNDSGFITNSALANFVSSTAVTNIVKVTELPENPDANTLYLVVEEASTASESETEG